jgi:hypothetical protein
VQPEAARGGDIKRLQRARRPLRTLLLLAVVAAAAALCVLEYVILSLRLLLRFVIGRGFRIGSGRGVWWTWLPFLCCCGGERNWVIWLLGSHRFVIFAI